MQELKGSGGKLRKREKEGRRILADWIRSKSALPPGEEGKKKFHFIVEISSIRYLKER